MNIKISPRFGLQAVLFNEDRIDTPLQAKGSVEFVRPQQAVHSIYDADGSTYAVLHPIVHQKAAISLGTVVFDGVVISSEHGFYHNHIVIWSNHDA